MSDANQSAYQLNKKLESIYLLRGEPLFLIDELRLQIRQKAKEQGYTEVQHFFIDKEFDWEKFTHLTQARSLFSAKQVIELNFFISPSTIAQAALSNYYDRLNPNLILILNIAKLNANIYKLNCFQLKKNGIDLNITPLKPHHFPQWVRMRLKQEKLEMPSKSLEMLIHMTQGNMLACHQIIKKLSLMVTNSHVTHEQLAFIIQSHAQFTLFQLSDAIFMNDKQNIVDRLANLKLKSVDAVLVLWVIARELRKLIKMSVAHSQGQTFEIIFTHHQIWSNKQKQMRDLLTIYPLVHWDKLMQQCYQVDCIIKGIETGNKWDELENLCLSIIPK